MNKKQELKERIYKHNPELKELSFGCEVLEYEIGRGILLTDAIEKNGIVACYIYDFVDGKSKNVPFLKEKLEILGHPIQPHHVLIALKGSDEVVGMLTTGEFIKDHYCGMGEDDKTGIFYDLEKSFDQNCENPELVDFLLEVIK